MIARPRNHRTLADDFEPGGLHVFIPGALASGFLVSVVVLIGDVFQRVRGSAASDRRVPLTAAALAEQVRSGADGARAVGIGLRPSWVYGGVGALAATLALTVFPGATWNFLNPAGYIDHIGWIWIISLLLALPAGIIGIQLLRLAPAWVPWTALLLGGSGAIRFAVGSEPDVVRLVASTVSLGAGVAIAGATWGWRRRAGRVDVPPSIRPLLRATPLGAVTRPLSELGEPRRG